MPILKFLKTNGLNFFSFKIYKNNEKHKTYFIDYYRCKKIN